MDNQRELASLGIHCNDIIQEIIKKDIRNLDEVDVTKVTKMFQQALVKVLKRKTTANASACIRHNIE